LSGYEECLCTHLRWRAVPLAAFADGGNIGLCRRDQERDGGRHLIDTVEQELIIII
jgi:hypothetical protein